MNKPQEQLLPGSLKSLVRYTLDQLGQGIKQIYGDKSFKLIEAIRKDMISLRKKNHDYSFTVLKKWRSKIKTLNSQELYHINQAFSLYMELINRCERAYRSHRLQTKEQEIVKKDNPEGIIFVFTAHPTEARSTSFLNLIENIENLLLQKLIHPKDESIDQSLLHLLCLSLKVSLSEKEKPKVQNEAENIFSVVLSREIIKKQIELKNQSLNVQFRTWVGGDKDGHPFVNEKTLVSSLSLSRKLIIDFINDELNASTEKVKLLTSKDSIKIVHELKQIIKELNTLLQVKDNDGKKITQFKNKLNKTQEKYFNLIKSHCPHLKNIHDLFWLYPALVLPLEIREDSELVHQACNDESLAIVKMLKTLKTISGGYLEKWYVRGFVISMTQSASDINAGYKLLEKYLKDKSSVPIVPLFETKSALLNSTKILTECFQSNSWLIPSHQKNWSGKFEVMLGYSDSSKESGVLSSRLMISSTLNNLTKFFEKNKLRPVFFHGSGGSIERGGGSVKEQTSHWPKTALNIFKTTIQGEMVSRNFGRSIIMESMVKKISESYSNYKQVKKIKKDHEIFEFSQEVSKYYQDFIGDEKFIYFLKAATPYTYLDQLKIGSRPSKRNTDNKKIKLRAIPWVLCWTQTRVLFPTWWGIGSAWENFHDGKKYQLMKLASTNDFLLTFIKILGFTLSKIDLAIFRMYLIENLDEKTANHYFNMFLDEYERTITFFEEMSGTKDFLWFKPWLKESISLRSSIIHPINLIQMEALKRSDSQLLRESVTGIACGMLTTG